MSVYVFPPSFQVDLVATNGEIVDFSGYSEFTEQDTGGGTVTTVFRGTRKAEIDAVELSGWLFKEPHRIPIPRCMVYPGDTATVTIPVSF